MCNTLKIDLALLDAATTITFPFAVLATVNGRRQAVAYSDYLNCARDMRVWYGEEAEPAVYRRKTDDHGWEPVE